MNHISKPALIRLSLILGFLFGLSFPVFAGVGVAVSTLKEPNLYIFSVGVDQYQTPLSNLSAAKNDAVTLADEFERRGKDGFGTVHKIVLLDAKATKADIVREFEKLARDISSNDVSFLIFPVWDTAI